jgi:Holliday junction resolvase
MGRVDIMAVYAGVKYPIEVKIYSSEPAKKQKNIDQIRRYLDISGAKEGWLIYFDRDTKKKWEEKIYWRTEIFPNDLTIHFVGC